MASPPAALNTAPAGQRIADVFAPSLVPATGTRPADGLKAYEELSATQQRLLGPNGSGLYAGLTPKQRGVFLLLTQRLERNGVDLGNLRLKGGAEGIRGNNIRFDLLFEPDPEAMARFKSSVQDAAKAGRFSEDQPSSFFHRGMSDWGVRENRAKYAMQIGFGPEGVFVDMDRYNPKQGGFWNKVKHWGEILTPGNMNPFKVAPDLGEDIFSKLPPAQG
ncbi:MAG: hypothetical protein JXB05_05685 [Myxococcaceae bacterium]|nr:hypothetical protein [Myxococcaceae bacterium]